MDENEKAIENERRKAQRPLWPDKRTRQMEDLSLTTRRRFKNTHDEPTWSELRQRENLSHAYYQENIGRTQDRGSVGRRTVDGRSLIFDNFHSSTFRTREQAGVGSSLEGAGAGAGAGAGKPNAKSVFKRNVGNDPLAFTDSTEMDSIHMRRETDEFAYHKQGKASKTRGKYELGSVSNEEHRKIMRGTQESQHEFLMKHYREGKDFDPDDESKFISLDKSEKNK